MQKLMASLSLCNNKTRSSMSERRQQIQSLSPRDNKKSFKYPCYKSENPVSEEFMEQLVASLENEMESLKENNKEIE